MSKSSSTFSAKKWKFLRNFNFHKMIQLISVSPSLSISHISRLWVNYAKASPIRRFAYTQICYVRLHRIESSTICVSFTRKHISANRIPSNIAPSMVMQSRIRMNSNTRHSVRARGTQSSREEKMFVPRARERAKIVDILIQGNINLEYFFITSALYYFSSSRFFLFLVVWFNFNTWTLIIHIWLV